MKRIQKRILALMLALMMVFSYLPTNVFAAAPAGSTESVDDPVEATVNAEVFFVQPTTKRIITLDGIENNPIECRTLYDGKTVPANGLFKTYYGKGTSGVIEGKTVVNFTCDAVNTSWKADNDKIFQIRKRTNPSGWESVQIEPQGDGTIAFKSSANNKYFSLEGDTLVLVEIKDTEKVSTNEKFIMHTTTAPKTAKKVTIDNVAGDAATVSWQGVDECLYSGYEVLYSTTEDGEYKSAGKTADTKFNVTGLKLSTKYFFKVRTLTNNEDGPYADSKAAYAVTLNDYKPSVPSNVKVENKDGKFVLNWDKANSAKSYKVYRAVSRFAEYKEIGTTKEPKFTDNAPNASKYKNYYKIQALNDVDKSDLSDPVSLETMMFGKNMYIFAPTDDMTQIKATTDQIFDKQHYSQFGNARYALAYKPGNYVDANLVNVGYYTQILGLGKVPTDTTLYNVHAPAALSNNNATCNFWVGIENVKIKDVENNGDAWFDFNWSVSQAAPARRLYVERKAHFDWYYGWASGGFVSDTYFEKPAGSYSQQQYYYRNCAMAQGAYGVNWNNVIQGCVGINAGNTSDNSGKPMSGATPLVSGLGTANWTQRGCTTIIDKTPVIREKPFLYFDVQADKYKVFIPALRKNSEGISWSDHDMGKGTSIGVDKYFYIASPERDSAATINAQLKAGKNILFQPGVYRVSEPIKVTRANTVLLGLGMATLIPDNEESAIVTNDVGGLAICGLILDAGNHSKTLLTVGKEGSNKDHSENPTVLQDVIYRVGGTGRLGRCDSCQVINSNDVIIDHTWIWRADHGDNTGWTKNTSKNGLIVNGNNVTSYGLFCEHFQEYDIIWRGENGKTFFLQNEKCYDPQNQKEWMSHNGTKKGYAAYKVTNNVKKHYAVGLGIYDVFINTNGAGIYLDNAMEVPNKKDVLIENVCITEIASATGPQVGINHIINNTTAGIRTGAGSGGGYAIQRLLSYCNAASESLPDEYTQKDNVTVQKETGENPTKDVYADKDIVKEKPSKDDETPLWEMTEDLFDKKMATSEKDPEGGNSGGTNPVNGFKVGQKFNSGKYTYKITKLTGKTGNVTLAKVQTKYRKKLKKATVKASVKVSGYTFKVTAVGKKAFAKCKKLKAVVIGKNVAKINAKAFYQSRKLKKVTVKGKKLKRISKSTFNKKVRRTVKIKAKKKIKKKVLKSLKRKK